MRRRAGHRLSMFLSLTILLLILIAAIWPTKYLPHNPLEMNLSNRFLPIMGTDKNGQRYILGADQLGRDMIGRLAYSGRYSLLTALSATLLTTLFAIVFGLSAGYIGGWYDALIMRLVDALLSLPVILIAVALAAIVGRGLGSLIAILAFTGWAGYTRILRGEALALRSSTFVEASEAMGASTFHILLKTILPNTYSTVTVMSTFSIGRFILVESAISFLGMGIAPPKSSWGVMIGEAREYIFDAPMASILPGIMIVLTVMSINFLGDGLRDMWDPRSRTV